MADVIVQILKDYDSARRRSTRLREIARTHDSIAGAKEYADIAGRLMTEAVTKNLDPSTMDAETLEPVLTQVLSRLHLDVSRVTANVHRALNRAAGIGLNGLEVSFDQHLASQVVEAIAGKETTAEFILNQVANVALQAMDKTMARNAEAEDDAGLTVRIVRKYDDVGVHDGKDPCEWCLAREGEWDSYEEAFNAGAFERHPGCGCFIDYHVGKTHTVQRRAGSWTNW